MAPVLRSVYSMMQMPGPSIGTLRNYLSKAISKVGASNRFEAA